MDINDPMNKTSTSTLFRFAVVALTALMLAGCASVPAPAADPTPDKVYEFEAWDGDGMEIPLDGSSLEAFETSMARVQAHTSPENYITLENAIDYLLVYDLSARKDKAKLAHNLDGMTPYQVIDKVQWRKPAPGKSQAEKGAADAKIEL
jgi:hypothetical protein